MPEGTIELASRHTDLIVIRVPRDHFVTVIGDYEVPARYEELLIAKRRSRHRSTVYARKTCWVAVSDSELTDTLNGFRLEVRNILFARPLPADETVRTKLCLRARHSATGVTDDPRMDWDNAIPVPAYLDEVPVVTSEWLVESPANGGTPMIYIVPPRSKK